MYGTENEEEIERIRMPKPGEILAVVTEMLGSRRLRAICSDGKERLCRIPGKIKKKVWVRIGDLVIIKPWEVESDKKADVIWRYTRTQAMWLKRQGKIGNLNYV